MKANFEKKEPPMILRQFPDMTDADIRAWNRVAKYRMLEHEATADAMLISMLYYLATKEKDPHGAERLRQDWEGMIRCRAEARRDLRVQEGRYELAATGKNVEDYYMREELRKKGADVLEWERGVTMDAEGGVYFAPWRKKR